MEAVRWRACLLLFISQACAALPTQTLQVSASIVAGCVVSGSTAGDFGSLNFGSWSGVEAKAISASFVQNSSLSLACTPGTTLNMSINGGSHYTTKRNLQSTTTTGLVAYRLFTNANLSAASEIPVNQNVGISYSNANSIVLPIYGLVQLTSFTQAGVYTDTLTVTLSW